MFLRFRAFIAGKVKMWTLSEQGYATLQQVETAYQ